jgi:hypothetical protein
MGFSGVKHHTSIIIHQSGCQCWSGLSGASGEDGIHGKKLYPEIEPGGTDGGESVQYHCLLAGG